ncbi:hypothetical protein [Paenibacillus xerothermodurans]|uniref:Uncharacterized protein n=1 Tax=Paenibacillus xerothermodurans TaxID=1977292 RepID=A0A2W1NV88_PAEXE|nr:hypothetical protein [Paenibacillus xerothermodurans]PZE19602.1 hypothetical protein CBW46_017970 [Paenibacillus xerothermodurans]
MDRDAIVQGWLDTLTLFGNEVKVDTALATSAALPFWLDEIRLSEDETSLMEAIMNQLDEVTLMSYRDTADALQQITASKLVLGDRLGKKVFVGIETNPTSEPPHITFHEEGRAVMERELQAIHELLSVYPSYAGVSVHDYAGWRNLKE